ncbi:hypothetical protein, partial [Saccharothrix longispora]|uniref:hypothetical protein n=1 Tax=Saccharothrix longispora TaxID=33920 RepID=UPI0028FD5DFE
MNYVNGCGVHEIVASLHIFPSEVAVFPGTQVTAMILVVGPEKSRRQSFVVRDVNLDTVGPGQVITRRVVTYDRIAQCPPTFSELLRMRSKETGAKTTLGEVAKIRRGVATGASDFFFLTDSTRIEFELPSAALREALVKPAHCGSLSFTRARHE